MDTDNLSIPVDEDLLRRLDDLGRREHMSRSEMARTLIEEGLRMAAHHDIVFQSGPAGRRPSLAYGPNVWEVARVLRGVKERGGDVIAESMALTGLERRWVEAAAAYYAEYQYEIDEWTRRLDEYAERAEAEWLLTQTALQP